MAYTGRLRPKGKHFQASSKWKGVGISLVEGEVVTDQLINKVQIKKRLGTGGVSAGAPGVTTLKVGWAIWGG